MKDFEIERKYNRIGGKDVLKFYVPPLAETIYEKTHLILDLPHEVAYEFEQEPGKFQCARQLENGEFVERECELVSVPSMPPNTGQILRTVRLLNICDQYYVCFSNEPINFGIVVLNPSTNQREQRLRDRFSIILRQANGIDVGYGERDIKLPLMVPNKAKAKMYS